MVCALQRFRSLYLFLSWNYKSSYVFKSGFIKTVLIKISSFSPQLSLSAKVGDIKILRNLSPFYVYSLIFLCVLFHFFSINWCDYRPYMHLGSTWRPFSTNFYSRRSNLLLWRVKRKACLFICSRTTLQSRVRPLTISTPNVACPGT